MVCWSNTNTLGPPPAYPLGTTSSGLPLPLGLPFGTTLSGSTLRDYHFHWDPPAHPPPRPLEVPPTRHPQGRTCAPRGQKSRRRPQGSACAPRQHQSRPPPRHPQGSACAPREPTRWHLLLNVTWLCGGDHPCPPHELPRRQRGPVECNIRPPISPPPLSPDLGKSPPRPLTALSEIGPCSLLRRSGFLAKLPPRQEVSRCTTIQPQPRSFFLQYKCGGKRLTTPLWAYPVASGLKVYLSTIKGQNDGAEKHLARCKQHVSTVRLKLLGRALRHDHENSKIVHPIGNQLR